MNRDGVPRPRRGGRFLIVTLWFDPHGTAGAGPADKREYPKRRPSAFREFARRIPSIAPSGRPTRERGRPARILSLELSLSFPAMRHPALLPVEIAWVRPKQRHGALAGRPGSRRWVRLCQDLCGRDARAPGWASSHDAETPTSQYCTSTRAPLVIEAASSLFVSIRGSSSFPKRKRLAVNPVYPVHPCSISRKPV